MMAPSKLASRARALNRRARITQRARSLPALFFVTDETRVPDPCAVARILPRGTGILFRHYDTPERPALARALSGIARARGLQLFVAGDPQLARAVGAAGLHWPQGLARPYRGMRPLKVSVAAHDLSSLLRAQNIGADAIFLSPVFATRSGAQKHALGPLRFAMLLRALEAKGAPCAVYAMGGITKKHALRLAASGAAGFAAVDAFLMQEA